MKFLSWNVKVIGNPSKKAIVKEVLRSAKPDVIALQETMLPCMFDLTVNEIFPFINHHWLALDAFGLAGGILLIWNSDTFEITEKAKGEFSLITEVLDKNEGKQWYLGTIYGPSSHHNIEFFWNEMENNLNRWSGPWLLAGDFNVIRFRNEKTPQANHITTSMRKFNDFIAAHDLEEITCMGKKITWSNMQNPATLSKLDRFLASTEWISDYNAAT